MINELKRLEVQAFIKAHENDDPAALVLKYSRDKSIPIQLAAAQIAARQKAKSKLPFLYQHSEVLFPHGISLEQCSSEATAKYKASIFCGTSLTDLTGGFGVDTYFLSQVFDKTHHVEQNKELSELVAENFSSLNSGIVCHAQSAEEFIQINGVESSSYFIDPARRDGHNQKVFRIEECQPNLVEILPTLIKQGAHVLIKLSPILDIHQALQALPNVSEVHVVSVQNECKELLFKIVPHYIDQPKIIAVNIAKEKLERFEFSLDDEQNKPTYGLPEKFIFEPNASIMKSGGFNSVANKFHLSKLHPNSHLYTGSDSIKDFPGRQFELIAIDVLNKKKLMAWLPDRKANITVRNFPSSVQEIRLKTGIKDGGEIYLFATTLIDDSHKVLISLK